MLTETQRRTLFERTLRRADQYCVWLQSGPGRAAPLREAHEQMVMGATTLEDFECAMNAMLREVGSHAGFRHRSALKRSARVTIAAELVPVESQQDGRRWAFQHVQSDGPAGRAGIRCGDVLLAIDGADITPPSTRPLVPGRSHDLTVRTGSGPSVMRRLNLPLDMASRAGTRAVSVSRLAPDVAVVRVEVFEGVVGIDVAREISDAVAALQCAHLIVDLRGNRGGGMGCLRVMSLLCPDSRGVGFSVSRARLHRGYDKQRLPRFDRIPGSKWGLIPLLLRFGLRDRSVAVFSEGLGRQRHHGRVALLVDEASASAAEMIAAFAREYELATIVGTRTAGRVAGMRLFDVGYGYRIGLPVAAYFTWHHRTLEGVGVEPHISEPLSVHALRHGLDNQLARATAVLTGRTVC